MSGVAQLLQALFGFFPAWSIPFLMAAVVVFAAPFWLENVRQKQVRNALRRAVRSQENQRERHIEEAFRRAAGKPRRLVALTEEATRFKLDPVWKRALAELEKAQGHPADLRRLRGAQQLDGKKPVHPIEEAVSVRSMLESGATARAAERLRLARQTFPDDPDLISLEAILSSNETPHAQVG